MPARRRARWRGHGGRGHRQGGHRQGEVLPSCGRGRLVNGRHGVKSGNVTHRRRTPTTRHSTVPGSRARSVGVDYLSRSPGPGRLLDAVRRRMRGVCNAVGRGIRRLRHAVGLYGGVGLRCRAGSGQGGPAALRLLDPGRGPCPRAIRGDRAGPRRADVRTAVGLPADEFGRSPGPVRRLHPGGGQPTGLPRLDRGPPGGLGITATESDRTTRARPGTSGVQPEGRTAAVPESRTSATSPAGRPGATAPARRAEPTGRTGRLPGNPVATGSPTPVDATEPTTRARGRLTRSRTRTSTARPVIRPGPGLPAFGAPVTRLGRHRVVPAQCLLGRADREAGQHDPAVVADEHRTGGDVAVHPAVRVQHPQRHEHVRGDLGRPVRRQRLLGEQRRERPRGHQLADDPQRTALGEDVEDLVEPWMVGDPGGGLRRLDGPPHGRLRGPASTAPPRSPPRTPGITGREPVGQPLRVEHLRLDDLGQRHLPDQDFLPAVGVEGAGLGEFVLVGRRQRQAVAVGEHPTRIVVHVASPAARLVNSVRLVARSLPIPGCGRFANTHDTCRRQPAKRGIQISGSKHMTVYRRARHDFGSKVRASVCHESLRSSVPQFAAFAVYIKAYPRWPFTTNPRSIVRYFVPLST